MARRLLPERQWRLARPPAKASREAVVIAVGQGDGDLFGAQGGFGEVSDRHVPPGSIQYRLITCLFLAQSTLQRAAAGYHVTLARDATAAMSAKAMHAAHDVNGPTYARAILTTAQIVQQIGVKEPSK